MFREKLKAPTVATCPHRSDVRDPAGGAETATCALVRAAIAAEDDAWHRVRRDACEACCHAFPPTLVRANPVVASLIYEAASAVLRAGGVAGCDESRAAAARDSVVDQLDLDLPADAD